MHFIDIIFSTRAVQTRECSFSGRFSPKVGSDRTGGKNIIDKVNIIVSYEDLSWVDPISTIVCVKMLRFDGATTILVSHVVNIKSFGMRGMIM